MQPRDPRLGYRMARAELRVQLEYLQARMAASRRWSGPEEVRSQAWAELTADTAVALGDVLALLAEEHDRAEEQAARLEELVARAEAAGLGLAPGRTHRALSWLKRWATARVGQRPPG